MRSASSDRDHIKDVVRCNSKPLNHEQDLDPLLNRIGNARIVLLGEASHGTHEYYTWRAKITKRLIEEKDFCFVAVEGDWPDCYSINRYVKGYENSGKTAKDVMKTFDRWPTWMWANWEVIAFSEWLRKFNNKLSEGKRIGFYGLDVYSLWESMNAVMGYLSDRDPEGLKAAKKAFECFEPYSDDEGQSYARATQWLSDSCEGEVIELLSKIKEDHASFKSDPEAHFNAEQNALVMVNAEKYYRTMVKGGPESWNVRDKHMMETLDRLLKFHGENSKAIVWEHNTHIGDARYTDMRRERMINIGQLAREEFGNEDVVLVGFGSYEGSVIAGDGWGAEMEVMPVPKAIEDSFESIIHECGAEDKLILLDKFKNDDQFLKPLKHRAIGVVYHPGTERWGNYVPSIIPFRYDAFIYIDNSKALYPLHLKARGHQVPETYPWGF